MNLVRGVAIITLVFFISNASEAISIEQNKHRGNSQITDKTVSPTYLSVVNEHLAHFWLPAKAIHNHATVTFRINNDGRVSWMELTDAASDTAANLSALEAVNNSSPFPPPPSSFVDVAANFYSDYCPKFRATYIQPSSGAFYNSNRLYLSAIMDQKLGHLDKALLGMKKAYDLTPSNLRLRDSLIDLYISFSMSKPVDQAMSMLHQALLLDSSNQSARLNLNALLVADNKNPADYNTRLGMARDYEYNCKYEEALCEYGEAWLLKHDQDLIPEINLACRRRAKAVDICKWQDALKIADNPDYHTELGHAYEACDEIHKAIAEYRCALTLNFADRNAIASLDRLQSPVNNLSNKAAAENSTEFRDDFPYSKVGNCIIFTKQIKNRRVSVDYLKAACGDKLTRWANNKTAFALYVDDGQGVPGYREGYKRLMINAFDTWVKASEDRLTYKLVNTPQEANVACYWTPKRTKFMKAGELGVTRWQFLYHKNQPKLLMPQSAQVFIITLAPNSAQSISYTAMKAICLHELGHTLGITGHSPYRGDVMYATLSPFDIPTNLSDRDVATIKKLYQGYSHLKTD